VRNHGHEIAPQLPELFFSSQRAEQFSFCELALGDIKTDHQHVRLAIDLDDVGGLNNCMDRAQ